MKKGLIFFLGVTVGLAGGGIVTNAILKQQYEQKADDEIAGCREAFLNELSKVQKELNDKKAEEKKEKAAEAMAKYSPNPEAGRKTIEKTDEEEDEPKKPYEITEEIYGDQANPYKAVGITYFPKENVLLREDQSIMGKDDIEAAIGLNSLALFDDDRDRVIIRNDSLKADFEIVMSGCSLAEWRRRYPEKDK